MTYNIRCGMANIVSLRFSPNQGFPKLSSSHLFESVKKMNLYTEVIFKIRSTGYA